MQQIREPRIPSILPLKPNRIWRTYLGGRQLDILEGKTEPHDSHFPEDWIASTTRATNPGREHLQDEGFSTVEVSGERFLLRDLFARFPNEMLGAEHASCYGPNTQFLLKFLDSAVRLQIQCHPTIEFSKAYLNSSSGKTEAYVILGTRPEVADPYIYLGFQRVPDRAEFRRAIVEQDSKSLLASFDKVPVQTGDVFIVPGGVPHAIGEGVFMIEIMEPTDFVVRIEFECGGYVLPESARFMGRDVDFALSMFTFEELSHEELRRRYFQTPVQINSWGRSVETSLIDERATSRFRVKRLEVTDPVTQREASFYIGIVTRGSGRVKAGSDSLELKPGDHFLVPAQTEEVLFTAEGELEVVCTLPPKPVV